MWHKDPPATIHPKFAHISAKILPAARDIFPRRVAIHHRHVCSERRSSSLSWRSASRAHLKLSPRSQQPLPSDLLRWAAPIPARYLREKLQFANKIHLSWSCAMLSHEAFDVFNWTKLSVNFREFLLKISDIKSHASRYYNVDKMCIKFASIQEHPKRILTNWQSTCKYHRQTQTTSTKS